MNKRKRIITKDHPLKDILPSRYWSLRAHLESKSAYEQINQGLFFIGYPRSSHSILGALLDAHPEVVVSHELDVLAFLDAGFSKRQLIQMMITRSRQFAKTGNQWMGYNYRVPGGYQGRVETLRLVGDKRGGTTTKWYRKDPALFSKLHELFPETVFVHMYRNPFDSISTSYFRSEARRRKKFGEADLYRKIDHFFDHARVIHEFEQQQPFEFRSIRADDFLESPKEILTDLLGHFSIRASPKYLDNCASILFGKPPKRRNELELWSSQTIAYVQKRMPETPYFEGYQFAE
ncbi:sulfotransferase [Phaeodactylibacter sp.]|uniref:sulfotransferase n=1 Tax=Phaeodactylibacter sp. TaxID=1940289 RepID=UPI0025D9BC95|nr:sulfotransferase [Phaeodactylibacter sp.]MCI4650963.1 sulfotransferase [Phaeodactylibacter sp.]MCI5092366.1 sulfotransferase [Phaeodactylibacter sp.]